MRRREPLSQAWRRSLGFAGALTGLALPAVAVALAPQGFGVDEKAYLAATAQDPVARLQADIEAGRVKLTYDPKHGYLPSLLKALDIPVASQTLVFSKTSFQQQAISRRTPRALYFNDDVYVGMVQGSKMLEISAVDPELGGVFYVLEQEPGARPKLARQTYDCLQCHNGGMTGNVPGHMMRSVFPKADGTPDFSLGSRLTTDESPWKERWGGWYVTGTHGKMRHQGNEAVRDGGGYTVLDRDAGANVTDLSRYFDTSPYLSPHSDIVALMVLTHQVNVHNLIARARWQTLSALRTEQEMNKALGRAPDYRSETTERILASVGEPLLRALLFSRADPLTDPVKGTSGFAGWFGSRGPRDSRGRSLRQFDLKTRLFRYPCSYLIYSEAFDRLPDPMKDYLYTRLLAVLEGRETHEDFAHLTPEDRAAVKEILRDTKPDFARRLATATETAPAAP
jgi:hypothetical protein